MSATVDRPAASRGSAAPPRALARAEGLELLGEVSGSGYKDGARLVRRADGQMVQLGAAHVRAARGRIDGERDAQALAGAMSRAARPRLRGRARRDARREARRRRACSPASRTTRPRESNPLLALRWKVLVTDPSGHARDHRARSTLLFRPWVVLPAMIGFLAVCWFVLIHKGVAAATAQAFHKPGADPARARAHRRLGGASTRSATPRRAATAAARRAGWAPASTSSGRRSTRTSPTPTGCRGARGCARTWAASTSTPSWPS